MKGYRKRQEQLGAMVATWDGCILLDAVTDFYQNPSAKNYAALKLAMDSYQYQTNQILELRESMQQLGLLD
jgi:hypothetical protein